MNTHPFFSINLTDTERAAGFRLVKSRVTAHPDEVVVAVKTLSPSARLIKFSQGYHLQYYFSDTHPFIKHPQPPTWESVGVGPSSTIEAGINRFNTESIDPNFKIAIAPEDLTVQAQNCNKTESN